MFISNIRVYFKHIGYTYFCTMYVVGDVLYNLVQDYQAYKLMFNMWKYPPLKTGSLHFISLQKTFFINHFIYYAVNSIPIM